MANTNTIWQQAAHTTYYYLLAAQQEPYKIAELLMKNVSEFSWKMSGELAEKWQDRKRNQTTALGFQTGAGSISHPQPSCGGGGGGGGAAANVFEALTVRKEQILPSLWTYEAGNTELCTTDSLMFQLKKTHPRTHQDSMLIQRKQSQRLRRALSCADLL